MWAWLVNLFRRRPERAYRYWDGAATRWADPFALNRALWAACDGRLDVILSDAQNDDPLLHGPACELLLQAVREAFALVPFNPATGTGATEDEALDCHEAFLAWSAKKKRRAASSPTFSPATGPPPSLLAALAAMGSGSTANGTTSEAPSPFSEASRPPSPQAP
jgi:hypothetical protein